MSDESLLGPRPEWLDEKIPEPELQDAGEIEVAGADLAEFLLVLRLHDKKAESVEIGSHNGSWLVKYVTPKKVQAQML